MSQETKLGLIVGLGFVAVFAWLLAGVPPETGASYGFPDFPLRHTVDLVALLTAGFLRRHEEKLDEED
jgi:hypothetical protein